MRILEEYDSEFLEQLWKAIEVIEAQECLIQIKCLDYPTMKDKFRRKLHNDLYRSAHPAILRPGSKKELNGADLAALINGS